jgi:hypothetical protein
MCDFILQFYNIYLATIIQVPECNIQQAIFYLERRLLSSPESYIYLILKARTKLYSREPQKAIDLLKTALNNLQTGWNQLKHLCYWELGCSYAALASWKSAADFFNTLYEESNWSKATYIYFKAVFLYTDDPLKYQTNITEMLQKVGNYKKKIAGKSIPIEKFVCRKARKYLSQNQRLHLPALEILYQ